MPDSQMSASQPPNSVHGSVVGTCRTKFSVMMAKLPAFQALSWDVLPQTTGKRQFWRNIVEPRNDSDRLAAEATTFGNGSMPQCDIYGTS